MLDAVRHQAMNWANVDQRHIVSISHNEFKVPASYKKQKQNNNNKKHISLAITATMP